MMRADLPRLDPTSIDLTGLDLAALAGSGAARATRTAMGVGIGAVREMTYISVGLTILGVQRLQVRRRELERAVRR